MKKKFKLKNSIANKNLLLVVVSLILVMLTVVGATYSWIEQISNVEMKIGGEKTPMHIGSKQLNGEAKGEINSESQTTETTIDLSRYFYESGNMHLSSCYGDGNEFYFPKDDTDGDTSGITDFRVGTKDDANVNYISITLPIHNTEDYEQAYWFDESSNFFSTGNNGVDNNIRCSFTVDSLTAVYSANSGSGATYKTINNYSPSGGAVSSPISCRAFNAYKYYSGYVAVSSPSGNPTEKGYYKKSGNTYTLTTDTSVVSGTTYYISKNDKKNTSNANYSSSLGTNGNTVFKLAAGATSVITIKVWLEYDNTPRSVDLSDIDLKLTSSFSKTRRIFLIDENVYSTDSETFIQSENNKIYLALKNVTSYTENTNFWQLKKAPNSTSYGATDTAFYVDIPAYYDGQEVYFVRCSSSGFGEGSTTFNSATGSKANNWWETTLPDNYEDSYFTEFSPKFGSWKDSSEVHHVYLVDSEGWGENSSAYLWDNRTVSSGSGETSSKVVSNGDYPGEYMYKVSDQLGKVANHDVFVVFYDSEYTHVIFSKHGTVYKTGDLPLEDEKYYYIRSARWYSQEEVNDDELPHYGANTYLQNKIYGETGDYSYEHFYYINAESNIQYCTLWLNRGDGGTSPALNFKVQNTYTNPAEYYGNRDNTTYGILHNSPWTLYKDTNFVNLYINVTGYYSFKWNTSTKEITVYHPQVAVPQSGNSTTEDSNSATG